MNRPELLKLWLLKESNYLADGFSKSPMASTSIVTAGVVMRWLRDNDEDRQRKIYSSFRTCEFIKILRLPTSMSTEILTNLTYNFNKHLKFNSAKLKDDEYTELTKIDLITDPPTQKRIMEQLTENVADDGIPEKGDPFKFFATLIKFPTKPGTYASRELMY
jgi:hypothetical protein